MEIYRYVTQTGLQAIRSEGVCKPRYDFIWDRTGINGIPGDPLSWTLPGVERLIKILFSYHGGKKSPIALIHFTIDPNDARLTVREDNSSVVNVQPLSKYRPGSYRFPLVVVPYEVDSAKIFQAHLHPGLIRQGISEALPI